MITILQDKVDKDYMLVDYNKRLTSQWFSLLSTLIYSYYSTRSNLQIRYMHLYEGLEKEYLRTCKVVLEFEQMPTLQEWHENFPEIFV